LQLVNTAQAVYKPAHLTRGQGAAGSHGTQAAHRWNGLKRPFRKSTAAKPVKELRMLPSFNMRQLLEAGVHFGHQSHRWNPKMAPFIYGARNNIHIVDLAQTVPLLHQALVTVSDVVAKGGRVLFVGTKRQASDAVADSAKRSAQYYINHRWLGGTLTNWKTISQSIRRLRQLDEILAGETQGRTKKELLNIQRERDKLNQSLGGIKDMGGLPSLLFVIDTNKEDIAIKEAQKLKIPIVAIVDTNCDPDGIDHPVPGNDDAGRAITLYCDLMARAAIDGIERGQVASGVDVGAAEAPPAEELPVEPVPAFKGIDAPRGEADDLKRITGISPKLEQSLNDLGVYHFWQLADVDEAGVAALDKALGTRGRVARDNWVAQAKKLTDEAAA
jgi:small subunit ribosomal protein S2